MTKVQLSLTSEEAAVLTSYGERFGYNLPRTIRFVLGKAVESYLQRGEMPVFVMSEETESEGLQAVKGYREGRTKKLSNVDTFIDSL